MSCAKPSTAVSISGRAIGWRCWWNPSIQTRIPSDADFVFDARALPNPYWVAELRSLTGRDEPVIHFLESQEAVRRYIADVSTFIGARVPEYRLSNRRYLTIAIGCTGGQHRSVYIAEQLALA